MQWPTWKSCARRGRNSLPANAKSPELVAIIDANITIAATFNDEKFYSLAVDLLIELGNAGARFIAPPLWESETSSIIRMRTETKKTTTLDAEQKAYEFLDSLPIEIVCSSQTKQRARDLALQLGLDRAYDSTYLALALEEDAQFWTAAERFYNLVSPLYSSVKLLKNWKRGDPFTALTP